MVCHLRKVKNQVKASRKFKIYLNLRKEISKTDFQHFSMHLFYYRS
jgi:hypothetical protein